MRRDLEEEVARRGHHRNENQGQALFLCVSHGSAAGFIKVSAPSSRDLLDATQINRSDFTAVPAALSERWYLPRHVGIRTGIELHIRPGMGEYEGVGPVQPGSSRCKTNKSF